MPRPLLVELSKTLLEGTVEGKTKWSGTAVKDAFRVSLPSKEIQIRKGEDWEVDTREGAVFYEIAVLNEKNELLDSLLAYGGDNFQLLGSLYDEARANALNVDAQLKDLIDEVKQGQQ
jgi:hypothetical protein